MLKKVFVCLAFAFGLIAGSYLHIRGSKTSAQGSIGYVAPGTITNYGVGYGTADFVEVTTSAPYVANGCTSTSGEYAIKIGDAAAKTEESTLLAAFLSGKKVQLGVYGCDSANRPMISSIGVLP